MLSFINSTTSTLDVAIYTFTYDRSGYTLYQIAAALQSARSRGVQVRLVTDSQEVSSTTASQFIILDVLDGNRDSSLNSSVVRHGNNNGIQHNKFIIADGARVLMGSANWTSAAFFQQENNVLILDSPTAAALYKAEFDQMWGGTYGGDSPGPKTNRLFTTTDGLQGEVWFGADDDLTGKISSSINSATTSVYFAMNVFSTGTKANQIASALKAAQARGVDVRGVMDNDVDQWANLVASPAIPMADYIPVTQGLLHGKYVVIDADKPTVKVLTGSNNWSTSADNSNDENMVVLQGQFAHRWYDDFRKLYVERSGNANATTPIRRFGDVSGDNAITLTDYTMVQAIAAGAATASPLQKIVGDFAPQPGLNGHLFGDGVIDWQDSLWLAQQLNLPRGSETIASALAKANGQQVTLAPHVVTASFNGYFYIQQDNRAAGVRVHYSGAVNQGQKVWVNGTMTAAASGAGERYVQATSVIVNTPSVALPEALGIRQYQMGGQDLNLYTRGVAGPYSLYNVGLREAMHGRVTAIAGGTFWLDDGSGVTSSTGNVGVKVTGNALFAPAVGAMIEVTGVCSVETVSGRNYPTLLVQKQVDIQPL